MALLSLAFSVSEEIRAYMFFTTSKWAFDRCLKISGFQWKLQNFSSR